MILISPFHMKTYNRLLNQSSIFPSISCKSYPSTGLDRALGLLEAEAPQITI
jgi:hypothetical protein